MLVGWARQNDYLPLTRWIAGMTGGDEMLGEGNKTMGEGNEMTGGRETNDWSKGNKGRETK